MMIPECNYGGKLRGGAIAGITVAVLVVVLVLLLVLMAITSIDIKIHFAAWFNKLINVKKSLHYQK